MLAASLGLLFRPVVPPPFVAYAGLWLVNLSHKVWIDPNQLIFWGIAVVLLMLINFAKPDRAASATAAAYPSAGAIAGALLGIVVSPDNAGLIIGSALGALLGAVAFSRTPRGAAAVKFPTSKFFAYLCAVGLPAVVTACIAALPVLMTSLLNKHQLS
ncbi:MAG: DUF456 domain-containing protein [Muribaculaceae bacterium]|nr:DUF456 domain-containing protein [Muribaculaceae bacterium]